MNNKIILMIVAIFSAMLACSTADVVDNVSELSDTTSLADVSGDVLEDTSEEVVDDVIESDIVIVVDVVSDAADETDVNNDVE